MPIVLVPLIPRPNRTYFVILKGSLHDYEAAFFDLYCTSGKSWDYQSTVLVKGPGLTMPKFQLQTKQWSQAYQRTCGEALKLPGREKDMASLRLSSEDPEWARKIFSVASPEFFEQVRKGRWTIEGFQGSIVIYRWGTRIPPRKLREYVQQAGELAARMFSLGSVPKPVPPAAPHRPTQNTMSSGAKGALSFRVEPSSCEPTFPLEMM